MQKNKSLSGLLRTTVRTGRLCVFFPIVMLLLSLVMPLIANSQNLGSEKIKLQLSGRTLKEALAAIQQQSGFKFIYGNDINKYSAVKVTINENSITVENAIELVLKQTNLHYIQRNDHVMISEQSTTTGTDTQQPTSPSARQSGRITGKAIDERGEPLPGATIRVVQQNQAVQSSGNGSYHFILSPGTYTIEVSYIGFQTKQITGVTVSANANTPLDIVLKSGNQKLNTVVISSSYSKASIEGHYARQKNEAGISNGISSEQIAALPDKNIGETLKRISGISTNDNRRVVVRGIAERYNLAMMDGAILPSTDVQVRDFEFDIVPSNLIDNVIVSKTSTPDMSFGFGGGLIQINTLAIPNNNFTTLSFGGKYISGSTGREFLGYGRGKHDYLGFDDGSREHFPDELLTFDGQNYIPTKPNAIPSPGITPITPAMIAEQNKKIGGLERMGTRAYKALPGQSYQFSLGRSYQLRNSRLGFVGSLSYRNEQSIDDIPHFERGNWEKLTNRTYNVATGEEVEPTFANQYNFNTTWGALLNLGWSTKHHKITVRNFYSRVLNNQFSRIVGWGNEIGYGEYAAIREYDRPKFIDLLQHRINGEHTFGAFRLDWNLSQNRLTNLEKDAVEAWLGPVGTPNGIVYNVVPSAITNPGGGTFNRARYFYEETNKIAEGALSYHFNVLGQKQVVKSGYQYMQREGTYDWMVLPIGAAKTAGAVYPYVPVQEWGQYLDFKDPLKSLMYYPASFSRSEYQGKNTNQAVYAMLDNRFTNWLRLVWGVRAEYYKYERLKNGTNDLAISTLIEQGEKRRYVDPETGKIVTPFTNPETEEKAWRYLPSASLTATPLRDFNIRAAYSQSVVRPALIENSRMIRFDPAIGAFRRNEGVLSTLIDHYDVRVEWYPKPGEVISFGYFYKYFDKPVELYRTQPDAGMRIYMLTQNSEWAKVNGWEFDLRKSLGFVKPGWKFLDNIYLSGNLTFQSSQVQASEFRGKSMAEDNIGRNYEYRTKSFQKEKRPLYGQVPVLYNIGLQYDGERLGANVAFNHMGYKTFSIGMSPDIVEYERPRGQLDAQLSYNFLQDKKLKVKLNVSNLLNSPYRFYTNSIDTYKLLDKWKDSPGSEVTATEWSDIYEWKEGFSEKYEEGHYETAADGKTRVRVGDKDTLIRKVGASFSLSVSYSF
ncbi:TonB-dependent receptor [Chitinophaga nivalis]|uniref:TonB-dependent receptor n=1 Tax=Chitinophaga nivalis TaxID=2991709 RepID=A0ABT3IFB8_9BACT|nr:TonB-dependent receptor [Chitinophaga nivalis]MCW3467839.1 TonB-dependent receptor [Chitinophaga nivalis]MCW3482469.1 TonB-dependent receptor [Chitinophaga nivalis]